MAVERKFVKQAMINLKVKEFLKKELMKAQISFVDVQRTPLNTQVIIYCAKPGIIIGRGGRKIDKLTEILTKDFGLENPYIDVRTVDNPWIDASIVARKIGEELERGRKYRAVAQKFLRRIMEAGAYGAEIRISGKLGGERARSEVFRIGYLKKCGDPVNVNVSRAIDYIVLKPGKIGIKVSIMVSLPEVSLLEKNIKEFKEDENEEGGKEAAPSEEEKKTEEKEVKEEDKEQKDKKFKKRKAIPRGGKRPFRKGKKDFAKRKQKNVKDKKLKEDKEGKNE